MTKEGIDCMESLAAVSGQYDLAIMVKFGDENENGRTKAANVTTSVKKGLCVKDAVPLLSAAAVQILMELAGEKKKKRAKILAIYMERLVDAAVKLAGEEVMVMVSEMLPEE